MKTIRFWLAVILSVNLHALPLVALAAPGWFRGDPVTPPQLLEAWGNSDREGFDVDVVSENPGTLKKGDEHTPGGENGREKPEASAEPVVDDDLRAEAPAAMEARPEPSVPLLIPAEAPEPVRVAEKPAGERPTKETTANSGRLPGAPGGANMAIGTPSRGGIPGVPNGLRVRGDLPTKYYPPRAQRLEQEGRPVVWMRISAEGNVVEVKLVKPCEHEILNDAALKYASKMKFVPARIGNRPVECVDTQEIIYKLELRLR